MTEKQYYNAGLIKKGSLMDSKSRGKNAVRKQDTR